MDKKKVTVKAESDEDVMGKKASVLVITPASLKREFKFYFDQKSGLLVKTAHRGMDGDGTRKCSKKPIHSEFKKVNGIQVAMKIVVKHGGKKFLTAELSDVEVLEDRREGILDRRLSPLRPPPACRRPVKYSLYSPAVGRYFLRIECRVDRLQDGNDVRVRIANAADFEIVAVHIEDFQAVAENVDLAHLRLGVPSGYAWSGTRSTHLQSRGWLGARS